MESAARIRRMVLRDGQSIRSVHRETGVSRVTIRKYLNDGTPPHYDQKAVRVRPQLNGFEERLRSWYGADLKRPSRERRTAKKLYEQLVLEGYKGSYSPVQRFICDLKHSGSALAAGEAYIPLQFLPGDALQFDWSEEYAVLDGERTKLQVAQFRLCHSRKPFVIAYPRQSQEMVLDAFVRAFGFYGGVPKRIIIDNPKTMVSKIGKGKDRDFNPRFLALMNHYVVDPVACTPASGWEKGQVENQVQFVRKELFTPLPAFETLDELNAWLALRCEELCKRPHPERKDHSIAEVFTEERGALRPAGADFDGYVERTTQVRKTCVVQYDTNVYSVPAQYAGRMVSLRAYAQWIVVVCDNQVIANHRRSFRRHDGVYEPWHYVPLLKHKPGALRDGAPFQAWELPAALEAVKAQYLARKDGGRDFVELLLLMLEHGVETVDVACDLAMEQNTLHLPAIVNLIHRIIEPMPEAMPASERYPLLRCPPVADCARYDSLVSSGEKRA